MADDVAAAEQEAGGVLALVDRPGEVLTDQRRFDDFFERIAAEARGLKADVGTKRGREAIASMAYKVSRTKSALDDAGKKLTEEARARIATVDKSRREMRDRLDALRDEVRAPLTAWEEKEAARVARVDATMKALADAAKVSVYDTSASVQSCIAAVEATAIDPAVFLDEVDSAIDERDRVLEVLRAALARLQREEADRAELARLRAERDARDAEDRRRAEAEARAADEARHRAAAAEQARIAEERAQAARQEAETRAAQEAADAARRDEEARQAAARAEERRQAEAALATERAARERAEAEANRARQEREAQEAQQRAAAAEAERRAADREHRGQVMRTAKEALIEHTGIDEDAAKKVVLAIAAGSVPAVTIRF